MNSENNNIIVNNDEKYEQLKEVVGIFKKISDMDAAIDRLTREGFNPAEISMIADEKKIVEKFGKNKPLEDLMDDPNTPRVGYTGNENIGAAQGGLIGGLAYIGGLTAAGTVIAVGGPIGAAFASAAVAGGAFATIGAAIGKLVGNNHADNMDKQIEDGGIIIWIKSNSYKHERLALDILKECNAEDIHTHILENQEDDLVKIDTSSTGQI